MLRVGTKGSFSAFRLSPLLKEIQKQLPITALTAEREYLLCVPTLSSKQSQLLLSVLEAKGCSQEKSPAFWVVPRRSLSSPWESKALDILHHVGCDFVTRIVWAIKYQWGGDVIPARLATVLPLFYDRMTEEVLFDWKEMFAPLSHEKPHVSFIPLLEKGKDALKEADERWGLALSLEEEAYLCTQYRLMGRNPSDVELMMFAQANSEHCRHKLFRSLWRIGGELKEKSLFAQIQKTYYQNPEGVLSAYRDNAAVAVSKGRWAWEARKDKRAPKALPVYCFVEESRPFLMKVETHNHPTAIEPFAGAGTGVGGEIRDEAATGRGAQTKAGLVGWSVSHLRLPDWPQPWEGVAHYPSRISSALDIMLKSPLGSTAFSNEFGRPTIVGYFRTYEQGVLDTASRYFAWGYHKPVMLAGGIGQIAPSFVVKQKGKVGDLLVVLGGPGFRVGLGGGAASSLVSGMQEAGLDFASVQRQNPEMQRRAQEVLLQCVALGEENPILAIHDVGAGGLANALPELVHETDMGALIDFRQIPVAEVSMSALEKWCNESQERYVLILQKKDLGIFQTLCERERCPYAVVGTLTEGSYLRLILEEEKEVALPLSLLFGAIPLPEKRAELFPKKAITAKRSISFPESLYKILEHPTVGSKSFLVTIGDRTVGGLVARDPMVGPWQVPVADCGVVASSFLEEAGEAMSIGERAPLALQNVAASVRMAIAESLLNIAAANIPTVSEIRLSCNWMASQGEEENASLWEAVTAASQLCCKLGIVVPVGKDSLSMCVVWQEALKQYEVRSPVTLVASAFAPLHNICDTLTPELANVQEETTLLLIDLAKGQKRIGGSIWEQIQESAEAPCPDLDDPKRLQHFFSLLHALRLENKILAYHDRSDGGLWACVCEMAFAGHLGMTLDLSDYITDWETEGIAALFNEELGAVIQVRREDWPEIANQAKHTDLDIYKIGSVRSDQTIQLVCHGKIVFEDTRVALQNAWSRVSYHMKRLRDNPFLVEEENQRLLQDKEISLRAGTAWETLPSYKKPLSSQRPRVAILREQGVNGHREMAAAFHWAGFEATDVTMTDLQKGYTLQPYNVLAVCGGFSYGDVFGAGKGWAKRILFCDTLKEIFSDFFQRPDTLTLGVCNGCQMLATLKSLIPGASHWPTFQRNASLQFEGRVSLVEVEDSPSIVLRPLIGAVLPVVVSHGEGRATELEGIVDQNTIALRYVETQGQVAVDYPANPNGSTQGIAAVSSLDGRVTIMMPHPERCFLKWQLSWHPKTKQKETPWISLFASAREWIQSC